MIRRHVVALVVLLCSALASVLPLWAQTEAGAARLIPLAELSAYFNAIQTAEAEFTQINPDGSVARGRLYLHRPGRMRFEYEAPDPNLVIASAGSLNVFDARSNVGPSVYPLSRTPLHLILAERVDLSRARLVVDHYQDGPATVVVAQDPDQPELGQIRLVFTDAPITLRQWIVTDDLGRSTVVVLGPLALGGTIPSALFNVDFELEKRGLTSSR